MTLRDIERVLYFEAYVVTDPGMTPLEKDTASCLKMTMMRSVKNMVMSFIAQMGAEGIKDLLSDLDIDMIIEKLRGEFDNNSEIKIKKNSKSLKLMEAFQEVWHQA